MDRDPSAADQPASPQNNTRAPRRAPAPLPNGVSGRVRSPRRHQPRPRSTSPRNRRLPRPGLALLGSRTTPDCRVRSRSRTRRSRSRRAAAAAAAAAAATASSLRAHPR
eukprot:364540-Chlamydomonas_euryale.AAC.5